MIQLFAALALFLALPPAARPLPRHERVLLAAGALHAPPRVALDHENSLGSALLSCLTLAAPIAFARLRLPPAPPPRVSRRWLESSRLLL
jgi:hypothetical protein